jgi:hypothetical protein
MMCLCALLCLQAFAKTFLRTSQPRVCQQVIEPLATKDGDTVVMPPRIAQFVPLWKDEFPVAVLKSGACAVNKQVHICSAGRGSCDARRAGRDESRVVLPALYPPSLCACACVRAYRCVQRAAGRCVGVMVARATVCAHGSWLSRVTLGHWLHLRI